MIPTSPLAIEIFEKQPHDFAPKVHVSACYVEKDNKVLLLLNASHKSEGGKWGVPAGKLEKEEIPLECAVRELFEETGIQVDPSRQVKTLGAVYIRKPNFDYVYHMFAIHLDDFPLISLSMEHAHYAWAPWDGLKDLPLMVGAEEALSIYRKKHVR